MNHERRQGLSIRPLMLTMPQMRSLSRALLLALIAYLIWSLWIDNAELQQLASEANRLEKLVGRLDIADPNAIAVYNVTNRDAKEWKWRVYLPAGKSWRFSYSIAGGGSGSSGYGARQTPTDMLVRCRIIEGEEMDTMYIMSQNGSSTLSMQKKISAFLQQHWDDLIVDVAATEQQLEEPSEIVLPILSITVSDQLMPVAKQQLGDYIWNQLKANPLFLIEIGSDKAFEDREKTKQQGTESGTPQ